ncbi:hypothetical protein RJ640_004752 [Escallonia rubra]|uniref:Uncharacterized protein n=1 Tax=Escallonia rubra TaxID=112253 RepID=A0AA88RWF2_9ASTE|nr:hypothetical protein RJ640_004752 [Escallonia rubra]
MFPFDIQAPSSPVLLSFPLQHLKRGLMAGNLVNLYMSSRASPAKRLTTYFPNHVRKYNQASKESSGHGVEEKAPSTAEEFQSIAKEKERKIEECKRVSEEKERQGVSSQTVEKAQDGVKERCKEPIGKGNFHKRGDD